MADPMTTPIDELAGLRVAFAKAEDDRPENADGSDFGRGYRAAWNHARGIVLATLDAARSTPVPASNVSEGLREASEEEASVRLLAEWPGPNWSDVNSTVLLGYIRTLLATIDRLRAALAHAAPEGLTCLDYAAHDWKSNGSPSFCGHCWVEWPRLEAARRRLSQPDATEEAGR